MANDEKPVEKALMASPSVAVISEDSVNSNLAILMMDSGASGHCFDDAILRDLIHRLQDYVHHTTPRKIHTAGGAMLGGTARCKTLSQRQRQPNPRSGRYRGSARDWAQPFLGDDSSQKRHCNHFSITKTSG